MLRLSAGVVFGDKYLISRASFLASSSAFAASLVASCSFAAD